MLSTVITHYLPSQDFLTPHDKNISAQNKLVEVKTDLSPAIPLMSLTVTYRKQSLTILLCISHLKQSLCSVYL